MARFRGYPQAVRTDNGPEFTAHRVRDWLQNVEVKTLFIEPGSPWENDYIESFNVAAAGQPRKYKPPRS